MRRPCLLLLLPALTACVPGHVDHPILPNPSEAHRLRDDVTFLASDDLEGRGVGTPGLAKAAEYIADRYRDLALRPLPGDNFFFQPFPYTLNTSVEPDTTCSLDHKALIRNTDFTPLPLSANGTIVGSLVFVGYGISDPARKYDDYAGVDVHGKVVVAMRYEPHNAKGQSRFTNSSDWSEYASLMSKARVAADHGAIALVLINPPTYHGMDLLLSPTMPNAPHATIPVLQIKTPLLPLDVQSKQAQIDSTREPASQVLTTILSANIDITKSQATVRNVLAVLPGTGPHANEYIVVGAHYDHLGHGGNGSLAIGSHQVHHGADDNASGTAAVLAVADRLTRSGRLSRSIIFANFTAEEEGLIGSQYFVEHPPVPLSQIVAMVNLDMVGRLRKDELFIGGAGTDKDFEKLLNSADAGLPIRMKESGPYIDRGGFGPSDHMSFAIKKIPVLFFFTGMHPDYHRPTDTSDKINYDGIETVVTLTTRLVNELAVAPREPYDTQYDSQFAMAALMGTGGTGGRHASLGVVPDYGSDDAAPGIRITGTVPGSAAEKAKLQDGDVLTQIGSKPLYNLYDLENFLSSAKPGEHAVLKYHRGPTTFESEIILGERRG